MTLAVYDNICNNIIILNFLKGVLTFKVKVQKDLFFFS